MPDKVTVYAVFVKVKESFAEVSHIIELKMTDLPHITTVEELKKVREVARQQLLIAYPGCAFEITGMMPLRIEELTIQTDANTTGKKRTELRGAESGAKT